MPTFGYQRSLLALVSHSLASDVTIPLAETSSGGERRQPLTIPYKRKIRSSHTVHNEMNDNGRKVELLETASKGIPIDMVISIFQVYFIHYFPFFVLTFSHKVDDLLENFGVITNPLSGKKLF